MTTPVAVNGRVKRGALGQHVSRIKMLTGLKNPRYAALQADFHLPLQNEDPLRVGRTMKLAPETHRALTQLKAIGSHQARQHRLRAALAEWNLLFAKSGTSVG